MSPADDHRFPAEPSYAENNTLGAMAGDLVKAPLTWPPLRCRSNDVVRFS